MHDLSVSRGKIKESSVGLSVCIRAILTDGTLAASTWTPEEFSRALTTFSLPE